MRIDPITETDVAKLHECFELDADRGVLIWKMKIASKVIVGTEAGSAKSGGYHCIQLFKRRFLLHRAIYAMVHGRCDGEVDHINRNPADNRPCNLRQVTRSQQNMNKSPSQKNQIGLQGVTLHLRSGLYNARVRANNKRISLGYFKTADEAHSAYNEAVKRLHGEYMRAY